MRVSLIVPDLLWGRADNTPLFETLDSLPGASLLAARSPTVVGYHPAEAILAASCGHDRDPGGIDFAALRYRGESDRQGNEGREPARRVLCADPVHFRFHQEFLIAADDAQIGLSTAEAGQLVAALNAHFAERARFSLATPARWYVEFADDPGASWSPLAEIVGRSLAPRLFEPAALQQLGSEAQMLLHAHPVNVAREAAGQATANGVWFWGRQGSDPATPRAFARPTRMLGRSPLLRGAAAASGATWDDDEAGFLGAGIGTAAGDTLVFSESLRTAACYEAGDDYINAWRDFSARCLEPAIARWRAGECAAVEVLAPCPAYGTLIWRWDERPGFFHRLRDGLAGGHRKGGLQQLARRLTAGAQQ